MQRRKLLVVGGSALSLTIAGCAGSDDDPESGDDGADDGNGNGDDGNGNGENGDDSGEGGAENGDDNGDDNGDGSDNGDGENGGDDTDENGDDGNGDDPEPDPAPDIEIVDTSIEPNPAAPGEAVAITAELENRGDAEGAFTVSFESGASQLEEETVTVSVGDEASVEIEWEFASEGEYDLSINGDAIGTLTVEAPVELTTLESIRDVENRYDDESILFSESGQTVTDEFDVWDGIIVAIYDPSPGGIFQAELLDENGDLVELLANQLGPAAGAVAAPLEAGTYLLEVNAEGDWAIEIAQPFAPAEDVHYLPVEASGEGPDVVGPVRLDGFATVTAEHDGESNFQVEAIDEAGSSFFDSEIIFNEIGEFEGESTVTLDAYAWISVNADGEWSLEIE